MKLLRYALEGIALVLIMSLFSLLPTFAASGAGALLGRIAGPLMGVSRRAQASMQQALHLSDEQAKRSVRDMWDNLGRVVAEYPHIRFLAHERTIVTGQDILRAIPKGRPVIFLGGHCGNWEIIPSVISRYAGVEPAVVFRPPNNPFADRILHFFRTRGGASELIGKSRAGARDIVSCLKEGRSMALLIDQRYNEGIPVPFFGRPAMTSAGFANLARNYNALVIPTLTRRIKGTQLEIAFCPPLDLSQNDEKVIADFHALLEGWIRASPAQWLWTHRRWDSSVLNRLDPSGTKALSKTND